MIPFRKKPAKVNGHEPTSDDQKACNQGIRLARERRQATADLRQSLKRLGEQLKQDGIPAK